jgi:hypothetical protein
MQPYISILVFFFQDTLYLIIFRNLYLSIFFRDSLYLSIVHVVAVVYTLASPLLMLVLASLVCVDASFFSSLMCCLSCCLLGSCPIDLGDKYF